MSMLEHATKQEREDAFVSLLGYLIENEIIDDSILAGISKKVIADEGTDNLSSKQKYRFENDVLPLVNISCDDCEEPIDITQVKDVYIDGRMCCFNCTHRREKYMED